MTFSFGLKKYHFRSLLFTQAFFSPKEINATALLEFKKKSQRKKSPNLRRQVWMSPRKKTKRKESLKIKNPLRNGYNYNSVKRIFIPRFILLKFIPTLMISSSRL